MFGFAESVVVVIVPQFERAFCYTDVGLNLLVILSFDHVCFRYEYKLN